MANRNSGQPTNAPVLSSNHFLTLRTVAEGC